MSLKWELFPHVMQIYTNLQTSQGYIFRALQHFATKLGKSTNFRMFVLAVVKDFVRLAQIGSYSNMQIVHLLYHTFLNYR